MGVISVVGFFAEASRRKLFRFVALYIVAAWVALQVADLAFPGMDVPEQAIRYIWVGAFMLFPLVVLFGWRYDFTKRGVVRTPPVGTTTALPLSIPDYAILASLSALAFAIVITLGGRIGNMRSMGPPDLAMRDIAPNSIAVLPLENLTGNVGQAYFVAGMHEALITGLSRIAGFRVTSRTSTRAYESTTKLLPAIARELGVATLVEGSVSQAGDRVRITVQAIKADTDEHLWAETYDRDLRDVLSIQNEVALAIAREIEIRLSPVEETQLAQSRPVDPETYELYLRGMFHVNSYTPDGFEKGMALLHEAVALDPGEPLPYAQLALGYAQVGHGPGAPPDAFPKAIAAAKQALALDPNLAEAHGALAEAILYYEWDWPAAGAAFERGLELNPNMAAVRGNYGYYHALFGRQEEARAECRRAIELDPLNPLWPSFMGWLMLWADDPEGALETVLGAIELSPGHPLANYVLGQIYTAMGEYDDAIAAQTIAGESSPAFRFGLGHAYAITGQEEEARRIAEQIEASDRPDTWGLAEIYAALGDNDVAIDWLQAGVKERRDWMPWIQHNKAYRPLFGDPRFKDLNQEMKLPDLIGAH
ncbi:MAG: tetratricopeptide repeat protein [Gammaproteobacteria bacterium]